jgi:hypothetical protein
MCPLSRRVIPKAAKVRQHIRYPEYSSATYKVLLNIVLVIISDTIRIKAEQIIIPDNAPPKTENLSIIVINLLFMISPLVFIIEYLKINIYL